MQFAPGTDPLSLVIIFLKLMKGRTLYPSMLADKLFEKSESNCLSLRVLLSWPNVLEPLRAELNTALTVNIQKLKIIKRVSLLEFLVAGYRESNPYELPMPTRHGHATLCTK